MEGFVRFLQVNELVAIQNEGELKYLVKRGMVKKKWFEWIVHNYLFFKIPLVRPDVWLDRAMPVVNRLLNYRLILFVRVLGVIGVFLVIRQWEEFKTTFLYFFSWDGFYFI